MQKLLRLWEGLTQSSSQNMTKSMILEAIESCISDAIAKSDWANRAIVTSLSMCSWGENSTEIYTMPLTSSSVEHTSYIDCFEASPQSRSIVCWDILLQTQYLHVQGAWEAQRPCEHTETKEYILAPSMERLLSKTQGQGTHACAIPVLNRFQHVVGLVVIEARCRAALGSMFVWDDCLDHMQAILHMSQPFLGEQQAKIVGEQSIVEQMKNLASDFVTHALNVEPNEQQLDFDMFNALRGYVLENARAQMSSLDEVYALFNRDNLVKQRNHYRNYKREIKRKQALELWLSGDV